jgi:hypothetical protein
MALGRINPPPPASFCLLAILTPRSVLTSTSLLAFVGYLRHTPSTSVPGICTTVTSSSARARLQHEAPATEAGLPSSPAASSSSWSSPSIAVPHRPLAPQRPQEEPQERPVPPRALLHRRRPRVHFTADPLLPPSLPLPLAHLGELLSVQRPRYDSPSRPLAPPLHLLH